MWKRCTANHTQSSTFEVNIKVNCSTFEIMFPKKCIVRNCVISTVYKKQDKLLYVLIPAPILNYYNIFILFKK